MRQSVGSTRQNGMYLLSYQYKVYNNADQKT